MNRYKKILSIVVAMMMFATTFTMAQPLRVMAGTAESTVVEASVTGGVITFDTSTGTVISCVSVDETGIMNIPETVEGVSVTTIGDSAFSIEQSLIEITLPDTVEIIEDSAFQQCYYLTNVTLPANLKSIGAQAFYQNKALAAITLPNQLETIGEEAFSYSAISGSVEIPASVTSIGEPAFDSCANLTDINVAEGNAAYRSDNGVLFSADTLVCYPIGKTEKEYVMPVLGGVAYIGKSAFSSANSLTKVEIAEGVTSIQDKAFYGCSNLADVTFPSTIKILRSNSFGATGLTSVEIPESTTRMWSDAFGECTTLTEINIPTGTTIYWNVSVLPGCTALIAINVDEGNTTYMSEGGILFSEDGSVLWKYPQNYPDTAYTVPATVTEIKEQAFDGCTNLQEIVLQEGLQKIGTMAFKNCDSLQSVTIPEGVTEIEGYAFTSCDSLKVVTIPSSVTTIGSQMLYNMSQDIVIVCDEGSAAAEYAASNSVSYSYDGKTIVGTGEEFEKPDVVEPTKSNQELVCADTFETVYGCETFALDASAQTAMTYKSNNTDIVEVDSDGNVTVKAAGSATITITAAESDEYYAAEKTVTVKVSKADQAITGATEFSKVYGDEEFALDAVAQTDLTYKSDNTAVADVDSDGLVTIKGAGTANITVTAADGDNYNGTEKTVVVNVAKADQTITGTVEFSKVYGDDDFALDAVAQTKLTYKSDNTAVADVDSDGVVTIKGAGTANITVTAADGANYNGTEKSVVVKVAKADQEITGTAEYAKIYGDEAFVLDAVAQTDLTYKSDNIAVADVDSDGVVTIKGAGTANITVIAADGANYNGTEKTVTVKVSKADQAITGTSEFSKVYGDAEFELDMVAQTELTYKSDNTSVANVDSDGIVTIKGAGTANITVTAADGANYNGIEKSVVVKVAKADQEITGATEFSKVYGDEAFVLDAVAQTDLTYKSDNTAVADVDSDGVVTIKGAGSANITVTAADGTNYNGTEKTVKIVVSKANQAITGIAEYAKTYGDAEFELDAVANTALTYKSDNNAVADVNSDGVVTIKGAGTANITVTAAGDNYNSAEKTVKIIVAKAEQTVDCEAAFTKNYGAEAFNIGAAAKTNLYYKSNNTNVAAVDADGTVTIKNAGTAVITVTAAEGTNYNAAEKNVTITVKKIDQTISCEDEFTRTEGSGTFNLGARAKTALSYVSNNTTVADVDDEGNVIVNGPGTAVITISAEEGVNYNSAKKAVTIIINKAEVPDEPVVEPDEPTVEPDKPTTPVEPVVQQDQAITGTSSYTKPYKKGGYFYLDAAAKTSMTYESSNTAVVKVAADGKVSIKGAGKATITVTAGETDEYKAATKTISVTINKAIQKITCSKTFNKVFRPNVYFFLKAKSPTKKTYKSSNKKIATVSAAGKVTMKNPGKVTITITAQEGKNYKKAVKKVTVISKMKKPGLTVKAKAGKKNKISWTKVPGAHGYKVYIYDKSKGKYICRVTKKASVKSVTHKGLKAGKVYKYKVRAYRVVNGKKVYSPYSAVKSVKAKK